MQLGFASCVDSVVHRSAAAGAQTIDAGLERIDIIRPVGLYVGSGVETHHEGPVALRLQDLEKELDRSLLLELEAGTDGGTGVDDNAVAERQVILLAERGDLLWG